MADGSPSNLARQLTDGMNIIDQPATWTYTRGLQSGGLPQTTASVTDPDGNLTSFLFSGIYETDRKTYQGSTLLDHSYICYVSGEQHSLCSTATVQTTQPITFRALIDYPNNASINSEMDTFYDPTYGFVSGSKAWDFSGTLLRVTSVAYNNSLCTSKNLCDYVYTAEVEDGNNNQVALTTSYYDGNGNLTQVSRWVSSSNNNLNQSYSYNSNGTLKTATDPNGTITTYGYGSQSCGGVFPDSVSTPGDNGATITWNYTYNCTGGVMTQFKDVANNHWGGAGYNDPYYWRPYYIFDLAGFPTYYNYYRVTNYGSSAATQLGQVESILTNGSSPVVDSLATADAFGRPALSQVREGPDPAPWDTVEYLYDGNGRTNYVTLPYPQAAGTPVGSIPSTGYFYDALNRYTQIATFNGQSQLSYTNFTYNQNDVKVTINPAPQGSTYPTSRQYEYNALGNLTSVCELTPTLGGSACGQNNPPGNGYMTKYAYDPLGDLTVVTQTNQTRYYTYDGLSRMTSEYNPETTTLGGSGGWTKYYYDSPHDSNCSFSSAGDKVERVDPASNYTCYQYDGLHRLTQVAYPSGPNTIGMPGKYFVYDSASPWGVSLSNPVGRLTLAYTYLNGNTYSGEMFGYDARGEVTDYYQSVGYWYHVQQGYAANGAIASLQGFNYSNGTNTPFSDLFTYSLDGEGRINSIVDTTTAATVLSSTSYNAASQPLQVGSETFTYYPASSTTSPPGSMNTWQSSFNGNTQKGTLSWNTNGTLQTLQISDNANPSNTQNCGQPGVSAGYTYDDVGRLASVNCGAIGGQTFAYDPYGNITKTANGIGVSFTNGPYDGGLNNHMNGLSYDGMGNVTQDNLNNSYSYDAEGRPVMAAGVSVILDAFGRIVGEPNNAGNPSWGSLVYSPTGWKFALMNQTSLVKYRDPMPGGLVATHNADGTGYYQHADWQGSSRLGDEGELQVRYDRAYAPFGEPYAELNNNTENRTFTGPQEDTTPGIDDFLMRQYSSSQGRWLVPDPAGLGAVDITNPQTWNRYAYVANNPLNAVDPLGLHGYCLDWEVYGSGGGGCSWDLDDYSGAAGVAGNSWGGNANWQESFSFNNSWNPYFWGGDPDADPNYVPVVSWTEGLGEDGVASPEPSTLPMLWPFDPSSTAALHCNPGFIQASKAAWQRAGNGFVNTEAGFWVTGNPASPSFSPLPFTNEYMTITNLVIPSGALALVHTHSNAGMAQPSPGDITNSNNSGLPFYVLSSQGLWLHNPGSPTSTMLRSGTSWQKPCK